MLTALHSSLFVRLVYTYMYVCKCLCIMYVSVCVSFVCFVYSVIGRSLFVVGFCVQMLAAVGMCNSGYVQLCV